MMIHSQDPNEPRKGQSYNPTKTVSGAGYAVGDTFTVLGTLLGGTLR